MNSPLPLLKIICFNSNFYEAVILFSIRIIKMLTQIRESKVPGVYFGELSLKFSNVNQELVNTKLGCVDYCNCCVMF